MVDRGKRDQAHRGLSESMNCRFSRRASIRALALGYTGILLTACSSAPTTTSAPSAPSVTSERATAPAATATSGTGPVTIRIAASWTGASEKQTWSALIAAFGKDYPNVAVELDRTTDRGPYDQALYTQYASGMLPDVLYTADNYVQAFKQNHLTQDLLPHARTTGFPIGDFDRTFLDLGMIDGQLHMLPRGGDVVVLMIDKKMVADAGVEIPWVLDAMAGQWTQDDFYQVCRRLTVDSNGKRGSEKGFDKANVAIYGAAIPTNWWAIYVPAIIANGGQIVSADLSRSLLNSPQAVAAFEWLTKPVVDGFWAPRKLLNSVGDAFVAGKAAITATVRAAVPGIRRDMKDDWDVAHFYAGPAKRVTGMGTLGFAMASTTKSPTQAWTWLSWMFDEPGMRIIASNYGSVPVQKRFYNATWWKNLPAPPSNNNVFTDAFAYGTLPPRLPFYTTGPFSRSVDDGLAAIEQGKSGPADVVKTVDAELAKWLAQNGP
jgi:multiple sugar transport system substrate-binding protein